MDSEPRRKTLKGVEMKMKRGPSRLLALMESEQKIWSRTELGQALGVQRQTISRWLRDLMEIGAVATQGYRVFLPVCQDDEANKIEHIVFEIEHNPPKIEHNSFEIEHNSQTDQKIEHNSFEDRQVEVRCPSNYKLEGYKTRTWARKAPDTTAQEKKDIEQYFLAAFRCGVILPPGIERQLPSIVERFGTDVVKMAIDDLSVRNRRAPTPSALLTFCRTAKKRMTAGARPAVYAPMLRSESISDIERARALRVFGGQDD